MICEHPDVTIIEEEDEEEVALDKLCASVDELNTRTKELYESVVYDALSSQ